MSPRIPRRRCARAGSLACALATGVLAAPPPAQAQEIRVTGPLGDRDKVFALMAETVTSRHDAYLWLALGGTAAPEKGASSFHGAGAEITNSLLGLSRVLGIPTELRWGPWGQMWLDGVGGRAEGGLAVQLYAYRPGVHVPVELRLGGGYGEDSLGRTPHLSVTVAAGARYIEGVPWHETIQSDDGQPRTPQLIAGWRLFVSARRTVEAAPVYWLSGGVEAELGFTAR